MDRRLSQGYTLVEVVAASAILLVVTLSFILSLVYASKVAVCDGLQISAAHLLQGEIERIRYDATMNWSSINSSRYADVTPYTQRKVYLDSSNRVPVTINYDLLTTFSVLSAGNNTVTLGNVPTNAFRSGTFQPDELKGNILVVLSGTGMTQRAYIKSNGSSNNLTITTDVANPASDQRWDPIPDATSVLCLNVGYSITVRLSYSWQGRPFTEEVHTLVIPPDL